MERFCQDPLESYFGHQRSLETRQDNAILQDFGFNDYNIITQKLLLAK